MGDRPTRTAALTGCTTARAASRLFWQMDAIGAGADTVQLLDTIKRLEIN